MDRRAFITIMAGSILAAPIAAEGQPALRAQRLGVLGTKASDAAEARRWQAFRSGLQERGWIEGKNIALEFRWTEGEAARIRGLVDDLVRLKVDLIVARSSIWVQPAKEATSTIPIVFLTHA